MKAYLNKALEDRFEAYTLRPEDAGGKSIIDRSIQTYLNDVSNPSAESQKKSSIDAASKELIVGQIKLFIFSGHDTTSASVCYSFYLLSKSPNNLVRIRAEHNEVFGTSLDRAPTMISENPHVLNRLPFTLAVIKETLRLFPVASSTRFGEPGFSVVAEDGRAYPTEECLVWSCPNIIQRSTDYWPLADDFIPGRWLVQPGHKLYPIKGAWRPFEFGPRHCIGQELALLEMKIALVLAIRRFDFSMPYDEWDRLHPKSGPKHVAGERAYQAMNGGPSEGMPCRIKLRKA
ncbi:MAG: hypothetical protein Q9160_005969 [Pyrenula sp. 1 TL-2023]